MLKFLDSNSDASAALVREEFGLMQSTADALGGSLATPADKELLDAILHGKKTYLDAFEAREGIEAGSTRILTIATESAAAILALTAAPAKHARLIGHSWGGEDLMADLGALAKGDEVVTSGGILGRVTDLSDAFITIEIADKLEIKVQKHAITAVLPKGTIKSA